nr:hypothetical protein pPsy0462b_00109 [Pseudomonas syringae]
MNLWVDVGPGVIRGSGTIGDKFAWGTSTP